MNKTVFPSQLLLGAILWLGAATISGANDVANHSAETNDRFQNDGSFIGNGYDFSGIGRTQDGNWATRIGSNYFISANHFHPGTGENVKFYSSNDPSGPSYTYATAGGFHIAGTDLWIGYFNEALDSSLKTYSYNTTAANSLADTGVANTDVFMLGNSITSDAAYGGAGKLTDVVVAQNQAESWLEAGTTTVVAPGVNNNFASAAGWDQIVTFKNLSGDTENTFKNHEGQLQSGDSGSPLLSFAGGELIVQGIAYAVVTGGGGLTGNFIDTLGPSPSPDPYEKRVASFYTYTGSYHTNIQSTVANIPAPVPEPSAGMLFLLGCSGLLMRRCRA